MIVHAEASIDPESGAPHLVVIREDDTGRHGHSIPLSMLGAFAQLLDLQDVTDAVDALLAHDILAAEVGGEPVDPVTGESPLLAPLMVTREIEAAREEGASVKAEVADPRSPRLRGAVAAHECVRRLGGRQAVDRVKKVARDQLGVRDPLGTCSVLTRDRGMTCEEGRMDPDCGKPATLTVEDKRLIAEVLRGAKVEGLRKGDCFADIVDLQREEYAHLITDREHDPFLPDEGHSAPAESPTLADVMAAYTQEDESI